MLCVYSLRCPFHQFYKRQSVGKLLFEHWVELEARLSILTISRQGCLLISLGLYSEWPVLWLGPEQCIPLSMVLTSVEVLKCVCVFVLIQWCRAVTPCLTLPQTICQLHDQDICTHLARTCPFHILSESVSFCTHAPSFCVCPGNQTVRRPWPLGHLANY